MSDRILNASVSVLIANGLNGWSVGRVSREAGCAKGLVNYHFESKAALLTQSRRTIAALRDQRRTDALSAVTGADAVDALWDTVAADVRSGTFAAWVELTALDATVGSGPDAVAAATALRTELARALELQPADLPGGLTIAALLDGMSLALLRGVPESEAQAAYQMAWPGLLG